MALEPNSALCGPTLRLWPNRLRALLTPDVCARVLHGSDVPVPVGGSTLFACGALSWRGWRESTGLKNPIERDARVRIMAFEHPVDSGPDIRHLVGGEIALHVGAGEAGGLQQDVAVRTRDLERLG